MNTGKGKFKAACSKVKHRSDTDLIQKFKSNTWYNDGMAEMEQAI